MPGAIPHHQVPEFLRAMDLSVAAYAADADDYFSPVKLFEYMAMALPVVAARIGQVGDVIEPGRTGWLYTPGDTRGLADVIRRLETERELCHLVGAAARERVMNEYTWRHNAQRVVGIAEDLIASRQPAARGARARVTSASRHMARAARA
jgi:glycosyltransferase involved in cell wall biosynthesis